MELMACSRRRVYDDDGYPALDGVDFASSASVRCDGREFVVVTLVNCYVPTPDDNWLQVIKSITTSWALS